MMVMVMGVMMMMFWWFLVTKKWFADCSHLCWCIKGENWGTVFGCESILINPLRLNTLGNRYQKPLVVQLLDWLTVDHGFACQVDDDCPVGITCNLVWGPSLEQNHLVVPFWVVNDWMIIECWFFGKWIPWDLLKQTWENKREMEFQFQVWMVFTVFNLFLKNCWMILARSPEPVPSEPAPIHGFVGIPGDLWMEWSTAW